jgi:hypothetical protein
VWLQAAVAKNFTKLAASTGEDTLEIMGFAVLLGCFGGELQAVDSRILVAHLYQWSLGGPRWTFQEILQARAPCVVPCMRLWLRGSVAGIYCWVWTENEISSRRKECLRKCVVCDG